MKALVLHKKLDLRIQEYEEKKTLGPDDVRIKIKSVGICGSDVHYYKHGRIGDFVVERPMVLGHEAAGEIIELGSNVSSLHIGDTVCMEPGIPDLSGKYVLQGAYNVDPSIEFWATPPIDGCLRETVVHPALFTYPINDIGTDIGSLIEPFSVGLQAAGKAKIKPGNTAVVMGSGTIGIVTALAALLGGCGRVYLVDIKEEKLKIAEKFEGIYPILSSKDDLYDTIMDGTLGDGVDIVFEATGNERAIEQIFTILKPAGKVVLIGMPISPVKFDIVAAQCREAEIYTVFRYSNIFQNAVNVLSENRVNLEPLISKKYRFEDSTEAFTAASSDDSLVKVLINL